MKKTIAIIMLVVLVSAVSVLGTLAYLTASDSVTNTFTVGKVAITLDEARVNEAGQPVKQNKETGDWEVCDLKDAPRIDQNNYKLLPGHTYVKDPTIHVDGSSEDCYIRATVTITNGKAWAEIVTNYAAGNIGNIVKGTDDDFWWVSGATLDAEADTLTITFVYKNESKDESLKRVWQSDVDDNDLVLFTNIVVPGALTEDELKTIAGTTITIVADAIQADGFVENSNDKDAAAAAYGKAMAQLDAAKDAE